MSAKDVDEYLNKLPQDQRIALEKLRQTIKALAPDDMTELISYGIPSFKYKKRQFMSYAGYPDWCVFLVMSYPIMETHKTHLKHFKTDKATIFFTPDNPLPAALVKKLVNARMVEIEAKL